MQEKHFVSSRKLFTYLTIGIFIVLSIAIRYIDTGNFFLAQSIAIFITAGYIIKRASKQSVIIWVSTAILTLMATMYGFFMYYRGPRLMTESDAISSVRYACVLGESYDTLFQLFDNYNDQTLEKICILKNIPLATSNLASDITSTVAHNDQDSAALILLVSFDFMLLLNMVTIKRLTKTNVLP